MTTSKGAQYVTVSTAGSYLSSNDKRAHFGLGADVAAKEVEIHWPSGIVQKLEDVRGDQILKIEELTRSAEGTTAAKRPMHGRAMRRWRRFRPAPFSYTRWAAALCSAIELC